ncbi:MAG: hypothetical protein OXF08_09360 [Bacteroidetes bacterium]|nr:hypothetical protein [Bacteroidota bacterium]
MIHIESRERENRTLGSESRRRKRLMGARLRSKAKAMELPLDPKGTAPPLDSKTTDQEYQYTN